jgi:hypothetical protein
MVQIPPKLDCFIATLNKVRELALLSENWDSYGSRPIQPMAIEKTVEILFSLSNSNLPQPLIFPVPGGGLQLEWQNEECELEVEVLPDGSVEYLMVDENGVMTTGQSNPSR